MIQTVKKNELARKEYHILPATLMEAMDEGEVKGLERGLMEGKSLGLAEGSRQKALETAKTMLTMGYPLGDICKIAGLSQAEVEAL